ncbi:MAG: AAA family ATPase [Sphingomonadaceae bacterium]|nr:AAA family ATPase [Sphingomonadaceae bacterium]
MLQPELPWSDVSVASEHLALCEKDKSPCAEQAAPKAAQIFQLPIELFGDISPILNHRWMVSELLSTTGLTILFGAPGAGKSFVAISIALHVASGKPWLGRETQKGGVVYVAAEAPSSVRNRVVAWGMREAAECALPFALVPTSLDLFGSRDTVEKLRCDIKGLSDQFGGISLMVIDTLSATLGAGDENSHHMAIYVNNLLSVAETVGCAVMVVTHTPLDIGLRPRPRGHGSLLASADTAIHVERIGTTEVRKLKVVKQRDVDEGECVYFELQHASLGIDDEGNTVSSCVVVASVPPSLGNIRGKQFGADEALAINLLENTIALSATDPQFAHLTQSTDGRPRDDACLMAAWKEQFVAARTKLDKTKDSSIRAFSRVTNRLKANKTIEFEGKWVWFTD